jgi:Uma2 family endonuclease
MEAMAGPATKRYTFEEYCELELRTGAKHEFLEGQVYAMAGASPAHVSISVNIAGALWNRLGAGGCRVFNSDMRVRVSPGRLYTYPDASVVCGEPTFEAETLLNATVVFEVLSANTERYDRGEKFRMYQAQETISDIVFISQTGVAVEHYRRQPNGHWDYKLHTLSEETLDLANMSCMLPLTEIYRDVVFTSEPDR